MGLLRPQLAQIGRPLPYFRFWPKADRLLPVPRHQKQNLTGRLLALLT